MNYELASAAISQLEDGAGIDEEQLEALSDLVDLFKPYDGDDPTEAKQRKPTAGYCENCHYETALMFTPCELGMAAKAAMRRCACPRCHCTTMMLGVAPHV